MPPMESTDNFAEGLNNARETVNFIDLVDKTILSPASQQYSAYLDSRQKLNALNVGLGEWQKLAEGKDRHWHSPLLTEAAFKEHFMKTEGTLQPQGQTSATFSWARLLFALNVRPPQDDSRILEWNLLPPIEDPTISGQISLSVDGTVFCHLINLYREYDAPDPGAVTSFKLAFGSLAPSSRKGETYVFRSLSDQSLSGKKMPFSFHMEDEGGIRKGNLKFEPGVLESRYENAITFGASDPATFLEPGIATLKDRAESLLRSMALLRRKDWEKPYLITRRWIAAANSIKKRLTTNGGNDEFLINHVLHCISERPEVIENLQAPLPRPEAWEVKLRESMKELCLFEGGTFRFIWNLEAMYASDKNPIFNAVLREQLPWVFEKLSEAPLGSWSKTISDAISPAKLLEILILPHEIYNTPVIVLRESPNEWKNPVKIIA
ncbi:hypothetical protein SUNI508_07071 [Seiridium unicorne]|uniref:Uncharacterized protein n=1 Tax=Seiridium unicorne TaxID=138068 RepID=A0ABR2UYY6_9PEZI